MFKDKNQILFQSDCTQFVLPVQKNIVFCDSSKFINLNPNLLLTNKFRI